MIVVFTGGESGAHVKVLESLPESRPYGVGVSWQHLRKRNKGVSYLESLSVKHTLVMDAGYSNVPLSKEDALRIRDEYYSFVDGVSDLPLIALGFDNSALDLSELRGDDPRVIPVIHSVSPDLVERAVSMHHGLAMAMPRSLEYLDKRVPSTMKRMSVKEETFFLGIGGSDFALADQMGLHGLMTSAWLGASKFGTLYLWDGSTLNRWDSPEERADVLPRYKDYLEQYGFHYESLLEGNGPQGNRLAAWSFLCAAGHVASSRVPESAVDESTTTSVTTGSKATEVGAASTNSEEEGESQSRPLMSFPGFSSFSHETLEPTADGSMEFRTRNVLTTTGGSMRKCDSCFLSASCPAYKVGSDCVFHFPVEVRTDEQIKAVLASMVEVQASRVAFARYAEELNGGYPDPVVGEEMDRLVRIADRIRKRDEKRERLTVSVESESSNSDAPGVLSRIFGQSPAVEQPQPKVLEADVVDKRPSPHKDE